MRGEVKLGKLLQVQLVVLQKIIDINWYIGPMTGLKYCDYQQNSYHGNSPFDKQKKIHLRFWKHLNIIRPNKYVILRQMYFLILWSQKAKQVGNHKSLKSGLDSWHWFIIGHLDQLRFGSMEINIKDQEQIL